MATNRAKVAARERARRRRLELDAERARRDGQIEEAGAEFFQAQETHRAAAALMSSAVTTLEALGESSQRIQLLLEISAADLRRVRQVAAATDRRPRQGQEEKLPRQRPPGGPWKPERSATGPSDRIATSSCQKSAETSTEP